MHLCSRVRNGIRISVDLPPFEITTHISTRSNLHIRTILCDHCVSLNWSKGCCLLHCRQRGNLKCKLRCTSRLESVGRRRNTGTGRQHVARTCALAFRPPMRLARRTRVSRSQAQGSADDTDSLFLRSKRQGEGSRKADSAGRCSRTRRRPGAGGSGRIRPVRFYQAAHRARPVVAALVLPAFSPGCAARLPQVLSLVYSRFLQCQTTCGLRNCA